MAAKAELRGRLTLNDALFHTGLRRAEGAIKRFATAPVAHLAGALGGLFTVDMFKRGIEGAISLGDHLWKLNKVTGINVGSLGALQEVSEQAGVELASVAKGVGFMQRNLVNALKSGKSESPFRLLGLEAQDLISLRPEQAFQKIGEAINNISDPAVRTATAMKIFGKAGRELLPVFSEVGSANFGNLSDRAKLLQENATRFHHVAVEMRHAELNFKSGFLGLAEQIVPVLLKISENFKGVNFLEIGRAWGQSLADGIADIFSGSAWDRLVALGKDRMGDLLDAVHLTGAGAIYHKDAATIRNRANTAREAAGLPVGESPMAEMAEVINQGYNNPLDIGQHLSGDTRNILKWKSDLPSLTKRFTPFGGSLSQDAFGQRGGLGSMAGWDTKAIMGLGTDELQKMLFTPEEQQQMQNQIVAAGGSRSASSPYAYGAVAAGDNERRASYLKQELKQKLGVDKSNELLEDIKTAVEDTAEVWTQ